MREKFLLEIRKITETRSRVYLVGLVITLLIALKEAIALSYTNFQIFSFGSLDFWNNINPYSHWDHLSLMGRPLDIFLYGPLFSILFTPFALLPGWLGVICWNIFTYTLFYFSVFSLPDQFDFVKKKFIFFFTALLLFQTLLSVQFNPVVAAIFLFSFTLLEKKQGFWAVLLIFLSGFIKVYGIFQIAMILFYPRFWRNTLYAVLIGIVLFLLPVVHIPADKLIDYYHSWITAVMNHIDAFESYSIFRPVNIFYDPIENYSGIISLGVLLLIFTIALIRLKVFKESFGRRGQLLGVIMSWAIIFSTGSETHTYVIAVAGYVIWYFCSNPNWSDKVLLWTNFILLGILPIDIFCPVVISDFILVRLNMSVLIFTITWGIMVYRTFASPPVSQKRID
jgi:hypothetical protein